MPLDCGGATAKPGMPLSLRNRRACATRKSIFFATVAIGQKKARRVIIALYTLHPWPVDSHTQTSDFSRLRALRTDKKAQSIRPTVASRARRESLRARAIQRRPPPSRKSKRDVPAEKSAKTALSFHRLFDAARNGRGKKSQLPRSVRIRDWP